MLGHLLLPEIEEMIQAGDFAGLRSALSDLMAPDVAELIEELPSQDQAVVFRILPRELAAETFATLHLDAQENLLKALAQEQVADLLNTMAPDDRTALLEELPAEATRRLLQLLSPEELPIAKQLLGYPEGSIGRLMTPDYVAIRESWTVEEVLNHIREFGRDSETLNVLYVTDNRGRLIDDIRVREILLSPLDRRVSDLVDREFVALKATDEQEVAVEAFRRYDVEALPVTDSGGVLLGIVTVDDVLDVAEEEATEDIQKLGGMEALEEPYMQTGLGEMVRKRAPWLAMLFLAETGATLAMRSYDEALERVIILASFVPLIMSSGGNSGSQAGTLAIRAMALGEVRLRDWWRVLRREAATGLAFGVLLSPISFTVGALFSRGTEYGDHWLLLGATLSLSVLAIVLWGTLIGSMLPFLLKRMGLDPATSSAPFVATLIDVTGLLIFFSVATLLLRGTLL